MIRLKTAYTLTFYWITPAVMGNSFLARNPYFLIGNITF